MIIIRGRHKGLNATIHQAANDWISADLTAEDGVHHLSTIVNPTSAQYTAEEIALLQTIAGGTFWNEYIAQELANEPGYRLLGTSRLLSGQQ